MKKTKISFWASLAAILSILYVSPIQNQRTLASGLEEEPVTAEEIQPVLEATIQILMFPVDSLEALRLWADPHQVSIYEAISSGNVGFHYERGLGTLVSKNGEIFLFTNDHWGCLDNLGMVWFRNAPGDMLLALDGEIFKSLIRYRDGGTLILGGPEGGDQSDFLSALILISKANYGQTIVPAQLGAAIEDVREGETLLVARRGRNDPASVELIKASVVSIEKRWGQPVFKLQSANGETILPGDSGGGIWLGGQLIGNMWKSKYTYGWNRSSLRLEQMWTDTSFASGLPNSVDEITLSLETAEITGNLETPTSGQEY